MFYTAYQGYQPQYYPNNYNQAMQYLFQPLVQPDIAPPQYEYHVVPAIIEDHPLSFTPPEQEPGTIDLGIHNPTPITEAQSFISQLYESMSDTTEWPLDSKGKPQRYDRHLHYHVDCITETDHYIAELQMQNWKEEKEATKFVTAKLDARKDKPNKYNPEYHCKQLVYIAHKTPFIYLWAKHLGITVQTMKTWVEIYPDTFGRTWDEMIYMPGIIWEEYLNSFKEEGKLSQNIALKLLEKNKNYTEEYGDQIKKEVRNQLQEMTYDIQRAATKTAYQEQHHDVNPEDLTLQR